MSRLYRTGCALGKWGRGVSGIRFGYYSSQGKPERTNRDGRMLHNAGNSSIQLFRLTLSLILYFAAAASQAQSLENNRPDSVGQGFETIMLQTMYQQMRATNEAFSGGESDYFAPSHAERIYRDMLDQTIVQNAARRAPLGVGKLVDRYLARKGGIRRQPQVKLNQAGQEGEKNGLN